VSPSVLAVFILMIRCSLVACCKGRSAGFSPWWGVHLEGLRQLYLDGVTGMGISSAPLPAGDGAADGHHDLQEDRRIGSRRSNQNSACNPTAKDALSTMTDDEDDPCVDTELRDFVRDIIDKQLEAEKKPVTPRLHRRG